MLKKIILSLLLLNLLTATSYPMAATANSITRQAAKELLKKGIEKGTTALHWAIAAGPLWQGALEGYWNLREKEETAKKIYPDFKKKEMWVREELKNQGFKNWEHVRLVPSFRWAAKSQFSEQILYYNADQINTDHGWLNKVKNFLGLLNNEQINNELDEARGSLSHEKIHLEQRHSERHLALAVMMPFVTHVICKKLCAPFRIPFINNSFIVKNSLKIVTGINKLALNCGAIWVLSYLHENAADEGVINDPKILEARAKYFRRGDKEQKDYLKVYLEVAEQLDPEGRIKREIEREFLQKQLLDTHPNTLKRAQRCEERAAQLHAAQQKV